MEIERKFLLPALPRIVLKGHKVEILQGYICFDKDREVRIRRIGRRCWITYKRGAGLIRVEEELPIGKKSFLRLWEETGSLRLRKTRYKMRYNGHPLEIDLYKENLSGLIIAEAEFASERESQNFVVPSFFGREITEDTRFTNRRLLEKGLSEPVDTGISGYRIAVLPVLKEKGKADRFVLVTSRTGSDWIVPRGKIKTSLKDHETAALECLEEAGIEGDILPETYFASSTGGLLKIYRMNVTRVLENWKEKQERKRCLVNWFEFQRLLKDEKLVRELRILI